MRLLNNDQKEFYSTFLDNVAKTVFKEYLREIEDLSKNNVNPLENTEEIGWSMGQVVLDVVAESTKSFDRESLLELLTKIAIAHSISVMNAHPEYKLQLARLNGLL